MTTENFIKHLKQLLIFHKQNEIRANFIIQSLIKLIGEANLPETDKTAIREFLLHALNTSILCDELPKIKIEDQETVTLMAN